MVSRRLSMQFEALLVVLFVSSGSLSFLIRPLVLQSLECRHIDATAHVRRTPKSQLATHSLNRRQFYNKASDSDEIETWKESDILGLTPVYRDFIKQLRKTDLSNRSLLSLQMMASLIEEAKIVFKSQPSLLEIFLQEDDEHSRISLVEASIREAKINVCGDIHGQVYDLLHIFEIGGLPSSRNKYIFNGDLVDRGKYSIEVVTLLLILILSCPQGSIYVLRGNHETRLMTGNYNFKDEVEGIYGIELYDQIMELFDYLPLAAVIEKEIFVVHGGIGEQGSLSIDDIRSIKRESGFEPKFRSRAIGLSPAELKAGKLLESLLWSDPREVDYSERSSRGAGHHFGAKLTEDFLEANNLKLLIRSHEVEHSGCEPFHNGRGLTVFSAPNYCGLRNLGAFIRISRNSDESDEVADEPRAIKRKSEESSGRELLLSINRFSAFDAVTWEY